jgi:ATP-binding cassette subfamily F protein 3
MKIKDVHDVLAGIMFYGEDVRKKISMLSGGERVRLQLLKMLLFEPELLILDEPTNHLDIESSDVIEALLADYDGPMIFITHDRHFLNAVADRLMIFSTDGVQTFDGNYDRWRTEREKEKAARKAKQQAKRKQKASGPKKNDIHPKTIERRIAALEEELDALRETRFDPDVYENPERYHELEENIAGKEHELNILLDRLLEADHT